MGKEKEENKKSVNDEILQVVKGFIDYFEDVEEKMKEGKEE